MNWNKQKIAQAKKREELELSDADLMNLISKRIEQNKTFKADIARARRKEVEQKNVFKNILLQHTVPYAIQYDGNIRFWYHDKQTNKYGRIVLAVKDKYSNKNNPIIITIFDIELKELIDDFVKFNRFSKEYKIEDTKITLLSNGTTIDLKNL